MNDGFEIDVEFSCIIFQSLSNLSPHLLLMFGGVYYPFGPSIFKNRGLVLDLNWRMITRRYFSKLRVVFSGNKFFIKPVIHKESKLVHSLLIHIRSL